MALDVECARRETPADRPGRRVVSGAQRMGGELDLILIVEDDRALREIIAQAIGDAGYRVEVARDGREAATRLRMEPVPAIVLLDIGLPFVDGWKVLGAIEVDCRPAVIVISARHEEADKVRALDMGADDYLTKPFGANELLARVRAVLRRIRAVSGTDRVVGSGDITVDLGRRRVTRGAREIQLSPTEWALLAELASHAGTVLEHRALLSRVWGPEYVGDRNYLRTFILRLRRKLEADPAVPAIIETAGRNGYRFATQDQHGAER